LCPDPGLTHTLPLETLLLLFNIYKDVPSKSTGTDACAGVYYGIATVSKNAYPFLLSLALIGASSSTSKAQAAQLQLVAHRRAAPPALAEM
jgi:hypothetical protein